MNKNNKTVVRRGVDFPNPKRPSALTLDWTQKDGADLVGNTLCFMDPTGGSPALNKFPAGATAFYDLVVAAYPAFPGADPATPASKLQSALNFMRQFIYVTYQGFEEPHNSYIRPKDDFIKMHDVFVRLAIRDLTDAQKSALTKGGMLCIDSNGKVGFTGVAGQTTDATKFNYTTTPVAVGVVTGAMLLNFMDDVDGELIGDIVC